MKAVEFGLDARQQDAWVRYSLETYRTIKREEGGSYLFLRSMRYFSQKELFPRAHYLRVTRGADDELVVVRKDVECAAESKGRGAVVQSPQRQACETELLCRGSQIARIGLQLLE